MAVRDERGKSFSLVDRHILYAIVFNETCRELIRKIGKLALADTVLLYQVM